MRKVFSVNLWRGLFGVMAVIVSLLIGVTVIANANGTVINRTLATSNYEMVQLESDDNIDSYYFKSEFDGLESLYKAKTALATQISAEGSVLLKNKNSALPIKKETDKVTLWGLNTLTPQMGGQIGSSATVAPETDQVRYDFVTAVKEKNFKINETMLNFYNSDAIAKFKRKDTIGFQGGSLANNFGTIYENPGEYGVGELPASEYTDDVLASADGTVAIAMITRSSSEAADYHPGMQPKEIGGRRDAFENGPLALSNDEKDMIKLAKAHSSKLIVLINSDSTMMIEELKADGEYSADAILWVGAPGVHGFLGVADLLSGAANPSAGLPDTMAVDSRRSPAMQNFGVYTYTNNSKNGQATGDVAKLTTNNKGDWYVAQTEGIYVGYKYYETRYADAVSGKANAVSTAGSSREGKNWEYASEVSYPFGYGLSYTDFSFKLDSVSFRPGEKGVAKVTVKNEGETAGKTPVQLYVQAPYSQGGVEKSAIQLAGFGKTDIIGKKETVSVTVEFDPSLIAAYDEDESDGAWVLDAGQYHFAVGNGAHAALNNILAMQGVEESKLTKTDSEKITADAAKTVTLGSRDTETYSAAVKNALQNMDLGKLGFDMAEYDFTRSDWTIGWKTLSTLTPTVEMMTGLTNSNYKFTENNNGGNTVKWGEKNNLSLANMLVIDQATGKKTGVLDLSDEKWDKLVAQMTLKDAMTYLGSWDNDAYRVQPSVGMGVDMVKQDGPLGISYDQIGGYFVKWNDSNKDEATYVAPDDKFAKYSMSTMPTQPIVAATFNSALAKRQGELMGEDCLWCNASSMHAPGLNLHRVPYNARNHEYYSEDSVLSGIMGLEVCLGAKSKGVMMGPKHYAFNHQESNRAGLSVFMTEQAARENELRCFQPSLSTNAAQAVMTAFNRAGAVFSGAHEGLLKQILRNEWQYTGWVITDMVNGKDYINWRDTIGYGGGGCLNKDLYADSDIGSPISDENLAAIEKDMKFQAEVRDTIKYFLYNIADSNYMNYITTNTTFVFVLTWWQSALIAINVVIGVIALGAAAMLVTSILKSRKEA